MAFVAEEKQPPEVGGQYRQAAAAVSTSAGANVSPEAASPYAKEATR
jgi:hypothetical protein